MARPAETLERHFILSTGLSQRVRAGPSGLAGTPDTRNTERYETWVANRSQPAQLDIDDSGEFDGPLFHPKNYRRDTHPARLGGVRD